LEGDIVLIRCLTNNTSGGLGGAIAVDGQSLTLDNVTLIKNSVREQLVALYSLCHAPLLLLLLCSSLQCASAA
jgi:predicted outer membrane repeat protein